jgi:hypothetical protein
MNDLKITEQISAPVIDPNRRRGISRLTVTELDEAHQKFILKK